MKTKRYVAQEWWSWDGTYAVWHVRRFFPTTLVWRGRSRTRAFALCDALNDALLEETRGSV
jgi:hypothetical protein